MPVDEAGNRADIVMDANSTISRMNFGRLYEQYINAASRDVVKHLCNTVGIKKGDKKYFNALTKLFENDRNTFNHMYDYVMGYYSIISPKMYKHFSMLNEQGKFDHIASILKDNLYLFIPPDNEPEQTDIIKQLEKHYRPTYGPVSYIGNSGQRITTKNNVRIGSVYIMLLEKIGDAWSAVSSGKLQHFGILSQLTKADKFSQPTRNQAVKAVGETEGRILASYTKQNLVAEIMDRNNNPVTHKEIVWGILRSDVPSMIPELIDRSKIPFGGAKPIQLINHLAQCSGWQYVYTSKKINFDLSSLVNKV